MTTPVAPLTTTGHLPAAQPFDLRTSIRFLSGFGACKGDQVLTEDTLTKAISIDGQPVVFALSPQRGGLRYDLSSPAPITSQVEGEVRRRISDYLSLDDDLETFYRLGMGDGPTFPRIISALYGLHHVRFLTLAEVGVWVVLSQRTPKFVSVPLKARIATTYGRSHVIDGINYRAFPELGVLAEVHRAEWLALVKNERKADYLEHTMAGLLALGEDFLREAPYDEATAALRNIRGIGEFSAAAILLRGLGRMDFVPLEMPKFAKATEVVYGPGDHNERLRRRYGDLLGYWAYYLHTGLGALRQDVGDLPVGCRPARPDPLSA